MLLCHHGFTEHPILKIEAIISDENCCSAKSKYLEKEKQSKDTVKSTRILNVYWL